MIKHFFFVSILDYGVSGWDTYSFNHIKEFDKKSVVIICNKKNSKYRYDQHAILRKPNEYVKNPFYIFFDYIKIKKILKRYENDKKYSHFTIEPYSLFLPFISNFFISNIFHSVGTFTIRLKKDFKTKLFYYFARKKFNKVIFMSSYTRSICEKYVNFSSTSEKKTINPTVYLQDRYKKKIKYKNKTILCVGAIKPRKGYHLLIKVLAKLNNKYNKNYNLILLGNTDNKNYMTLLNKLIIKNDLKKNVQIRNGVSKEKIKDYFLKSHIFVMLSKRYDHIIEGFGIVYLEALFYGLPIIISRECGAKDLLNINKNLKVIAPENSTKIANEIIRITNSKKYTNTRYNKKIFLDYNKSSKIKLSNFYDKFL